MVLYLTIAELCKPPVFLASTALLTVLGFAFSTDPFRFSSHDGGFVAFGSFHSAVIFRVDPSLSLQHLIADFFLVLSNISLEAGTSLAIKLLKDITGIYKVVFVCSVDWLVDFFSQVLLCSSLWPQT